MKKIAIALTLLLCPFWGNAQSGKKYFKQLKNERVESDSSVAWRNFGPGMSGYCEEFWCHQTDTSVMFLGPDMHVAFGTWDNGRSWHTIKDSDGDGKDLERVHDIQFSLVNPDYGVALERSGLVFETKDRGRSWQFVNDIGNAHTKIAIHPKNDNIWLIGAGDFWNVKNNHRSINKPHGITHKRADYGYVKMTTDKGRSWKKVATNIAEDLDVGRIVYNPNHPDSVVMVTNHGMYLSADGGNNWQQSADGLPMNLPRDLTSYYNTDTKEWVLYMVEQTVYEPNGKSINAKGGVYKSIDGGVSWINVTGNLGFDLSIINDGVIRDGYHKAVSHWLGMSKVEFKQQYPELPSQTISVYNRIAVNPLNKNEIYLVHNKKHDKAFGPGDVWKTEDGGKTWFACARNGKYWLSGKNKEYWEAKGNPADANVNFAHLQTYMDNQNETSGTRMIAINAVGEILIGIDQQTLRSHNGGKSWDQVDDYETAPGSNKWVGRGGSNLPGRFMLLETGIKDRYLLCSGEHGLWQTTSLGDYPDKKAIAVEQIEGQVHDHSGNHGAHSISTVAVHPKDPQTIYTLSWRQEHRGKLRRTTDGGKTWENIATLFDADNPSWRGVAYQNSLTIDPVNPKNMYFCATHIGIAEISGGKGPELTKGEYGFYRSTDGGHTWEVSNNGFHKGISIRRIAMYPENPKEIYAAANDNNGGLYRSTNQGRKWQKVALPAEIKAVNNIFIDRHNKNLLISTGRRTGTFEEGGVWRSSDNGATWKKIFKAPYVWQAETSPINSDIIVISVAGQAGEQTHQFMNPGVYLSKDGGKSWKKINQNLGQPDKIVDVKPDPYNENLIWCASWGCGWFVAEIDAVKEGWTSK
ncbi:hypothetical protein V6R21_01055 [Limibacter armeniacum]|uniref:VPS10 domain-containing protein n=1 Tax=Limibacter armeniacum TaxID=466084 RepID=UPI002FE52A1A